MAGSPAPADRPSSEAGPPHWQLGRTGPPGAAPASPACQSPGAYADLGALPAGREGPRAQGPCPAPLFPWKPAADRPERCSVGGRPARGSFPPRPETPIPPRFPASPAAGWGPRHHAAGSAAPAALHPNSALPSGRAEGSALCISQGIPVWGHFGCPPTKADYTLFPGPAEIPAGLVQVPAFHTSAFMFTHQGCGPAWQTVPPNQPG